MFLRFGSPAFVAILAIVVVSRPALGQEHAAKPPPAGTLPELGAGSSVTSAIAAITHQAW